MGLSTSSESAPVAALETLADVRAQARGAITEHAKKRSKQSSVIADIDGKIVAITFSGFERRFLAELCAVVARGEPPERFMDPHVKAAFFAHTPASKYYPNTAKTIYQKYVPRVDVESTIELIKCLQLMPGHSSVALDGVSCMGRHLTIYTVSIGPVSMVHDRELVSILFAFKLMNMFSFIMRH